ncbi:hypothetical protein PtB15_18B72 [Puccinia triticina]|nr:hypothetical protein PtB15_18B72 [Puccinia triticina]
MPSHHPSASGIQGWRASLPRDLSGPQESVASSGTVLPPTPDQTNSGRVTGCCAGQQLVSQLTEASGILAQCLDRVSLSQLRPSSSGEPSSSSDPRPSGSGGPRNLNGPRDLTLLARVRLHIKTLFGKCMAMNQFPPPVTEREKANWKNEDLDNEDSDDESTASSASLASDYDPRFPYPNGPGHQKASPAILSIMWRTMRRVGVVSFRPDLARSHLDADNAFLWDLAHKIFIKLVQAQEYKDIDLEYCSAAKIHDAINSHAKQIHRTYREAAWAPQRLDQRAILKRRQARTNRARGTANEATTNASAGLTSAPTLVGVVIPTPATAIIGPQAASDAPAPPEDSYDYQDLSSEDSEPSPSANLRAMVPATQEI